jgi:DNA-directed RNA polymerase I subunit RPA1
LTANFCPGHVGHIELTAPLYNPFLMKDYIYKLLKSKCFHCHKLRIHQHKITIFETALKLLKAGDLIISQELRNLLNSSSSY